LDGLKRSRGSRKRKCQLGQAH